MEEAGIDRSGPQLTGWKSLRHAFQSRMEEKGVDPRIIKTMMGHAPNATMNNVYSDLDIPEDVVRVMIG